MLSANPAYAEKYAGEIFYLSPGVDNLAMGNTGVTNSASLSAGWWNPALLTLMPNRGLELMHAEEFEGLMQVNHLGFIWGEDGQKLSRMSLVITHIGIDDIALTKLENDSLPPSDTNRPYTWKKTDNNDLIATFGFGYHYLDKLHMGLSPKLAYRSLASKSGYGFGADLGILWDATSKMRIGMTVRDCFSTQVIWENSTVESVKPSFHPEADFRLNVSKRQIPVRLAAGLELMEENRDEAAALALGEVSADLHAGLSVQPIPALTLMTGLDAGNFTAGLGISYQRFLLNYAYKTASEDDLGYSQRISAGYRW
jgi:hypothetical protein